MRRLMASAQGTRSLAVVNPAAAAAPLMRKRLGPSLWTRPMQLPCERSTRVAMRPPPTPYEARAEQDP